MHGKLCSQQGNEREISGESDTMGNLRRPMGQWDFNTLVRTVRKSWYVSLGTSHSDFPSQSFLFSVQITYAPCLCWLNERIVLGHTTWVAHWNGFVTGFNVRLTIINDLLLKSDKDAFFKHRCWQANHSTSSSHILNGRANERRPLKMKQSSSTHSAGRVSSV